MRGGASLAADRGRLDRLAALPGGLSLGVRARRRRHLAVLHVRRHRRVHGLRRRRADPARLRGRDPGACARRGRAVLGRGRPPAHRAGRRARPGPADAVDARDVLERPRWQPLPRQLLRHVPRDLAPRRLDPDHAARHRDHHRPQRLDDQPRRHPHGHERDLPRRALPRRDHRRPHRRRVRAPRVPRRLDAAVRRPGPRRPARPGQSHHAHRHPRAHRLLTAPQSPTRCSPSTRSPAP